MKEQIKYDNSDQGWEKALSDDDRNRVALTWLEQDATLDRWRHDRMFNCLKPILTHYNESSWVTIGDGRFGTDAHALLSLGVTNVMCTDISDRLLKIGKEKGFIREFSAQNAENLSFENEQFDLVLCKEAYHHLPRPHIALHEMLRVAKLGVVLIEPLDAFVKPRLLNPLLSLTKRLLKFPTYEDGHGFEPVGNYVFSISERELEKVQLGMHRRHIAHMHINDYYEPGYEFIKLDSVDKADLKQVRKTKIIIKIKDLLCKFGLITPGLLATVLFKADPDPSLLKLLADTGWMVKKLPRNPYL